MLRPVHSHWAAALLAATTILVGLAQPFAFVEARSANRIPGETPGRGSTIPPVPTATPNQAGTIDPAWARTGRKTGVQLMLADGGDLWAGRVWFEHVAYARKLVGEGGYVLEVVPLEDVIDPLGVQRWQYFMDLCAEEHVVPILRLATTYDHQNRLWIAPPTDPDQTSYHVVAARIASFVGQLRWPTPTHDVVVGNEPNRGDEWGNHPDPAAYARYLVDVGAALHGVGATVLGPTLDPYAPNSRGQLLGGIRYVDAESFLLGMASAAPAAFATIDVWASHAYPMDPFRDDPSRRAFQIDDLDPRAPHRIPPAGIANRGVNSYDWELWLAAPFLGRRALTLPVMITETGWRHRSTEISPGDATNAELSSEQLARYVDLAFNGNQDRYPNLPTSGWTPWNDDPRVLGAILFALDGDPRYWSHSNYLSIDVWGNVLGTDPAFSLIAAWANDPESPLASRQPHR